MIREAGFKLAGTALARPFGASALGVGVFYRANTLLSQERCRMRFVASLLSLVMFVTLMGSGPLTSAEAAKPAATLVVPLTGTVVAGGTFTGSFSISSFENRGGTIFAIGMVSGTVTGSHHVARSGISGPLALPVTATSVPALATSSAITAQAPPCDVLHLQFGGITQNLLGLDVVLSPVTLDITGQPGPLGALVCQAVATLGSVAALVGLLNQILGLLTGLLGGVA